MSKLQTMAHELAGHDAPPAGTCTSQTVGRLLHADVDMLPTTGRGHTFGGGEEKIATQLYRGVSTFRFSKRNVVQTCILLMAIAGAVLGTQCLVTRMRYSSSGAAGDHHHSSKGLVLQAEMQQQQQLVNRASTYRLPQIFQVGGPNATWKVPATPDFFTSWAAGISFRQGDVLRIIGGVAGEIIDLVPDASYAACTTSGVTYYWIFGRDDTFIQLTQVVTYNFVEANAIQCIQGLKFAATVNPITVPAAPPRPNVNAPNRLPAVFEVGGPSATWTIPATTTFYQDWASNISFLVGDVISFTFSDSAYEVNEVPYSDYEMCTSADSTWYTTASYTYQFSKAGIQYFVASTPQFCIQGMRFSVNVYEPGSTAALTPISSPGGPSPPTPTTPTTPGGAAPETQASDVTSKSKSSTKAIVGGTVGSILALLGILGGAGFVAHKQGYKFTLCKNCAPHINFCPNFHHHPTPEGNEKIGEEDLKSKSSKG